MNTIFLGVFYVLIFASNNGVNMNVFGSIILRRTKMVSVDWRNFIKETPKNVHSPWLTVYNIFYSIYIHFD